MSSGATANYNLPYPLQTDPVNVAGDVQQLAAALDNNLKEIIEDVSASSWTGGTFNNGLNAPTYNDTTGKMSMSLSQDLRSTASPSFVGATFSGDLAVNGGDITTTSASATLFNANATTLNIGQSASALSIGATTGTATIRNATTIFTGDVEVRGGDIDTNVTTFNLLNVTPTTINFGGNATTINVGKSTGKTIFAGDIYLASGKVFAINNLSVLSSTTLGSTVVSSSLTSVGTIATGTWNATAIAAAYGGTGQTSYAVGDILYASTTSALSKLAGVATGNALISGGVGTAPSWGKVGLTTHVSGTLAVGNGGTGITSTPTNGQLLIGNGTNYTAAALTQGTGMTITNGSGSITLAVSSVPNSQVIKFDTGTTEGTDLYTFNGSASKTIDIKAGTNITLTKSAGSITIDSTGGGGTGTVGFEAIMFLAGM